MTLSTWSRTSASNQPRSFERSFKPNMLRRFASGACAHNTSGHMGLIRVHYFYSVEQFKSFMEKKERQLLCHLVIPSGQLSGACEVASEENSIPIFN